MTDSEVLKEYLGKTSAPVTSVATPSAAKKKRAKKPVSFVLVEKTDTDCIIEKGKNRFLFLPSRDIYAIEKNGERKNLVDTTNREMGNFFRDCDLEINNRIFTRITGDNFDGIKSMVAEHSKECKEGIMSLDLYYNLINSYNSMKIQTWLLKTDHDIWKFLADHTSFLTANKKYATADLMIFLCAMKRVFGWESMESFALEYLKSSMSYFSFSMSDYQIYERYFQECDWNNENLLDSNFFCGLKNMLSEIGDPEKMTEYFCYTLYEQGFRYIPMGEYYDYFNNQKDIYGKVRDFYPDLFLKEYRRTKSLKCSLGLNKKTKEEYCFRNTEDLLLQQYQKFYLEFPELESEGPKGTVEILENGLEMGFDLREERDRCIEKDGVIFFMKKEEKPILCIFMEKEGKGYHIRAEAKYRRTELTEEEDKVYHDFYDRILKKMIRI